MPGMNGMGSAGHLPTTLGQHGTQVAQLLTEADTWMFVHRPQTCPLPRPHCCRHSSGVSYPATAAYKLHCPW